ncbi:copper chaperone PCu(A)C [Roseovarius sp.]|uniref:copper chaperone PCu(A)C n=1 Tax=Roseovarius sp. TaxID=1486281 RepID=UPI003A9850F8
MSLKSNVFAALAAIALATPVLAQEIHVLDTYARSASPMAKTGAAFMLIENIGDADDRLIGAASPAAHKVELHTHIEEGGVMKMVHVEEGFAIPAGETLVLQRGGAHVMMMGLTESFEQGKIVPLTLVFEKSGEIVVDVPVDLDRKPGASHGKGHGTGN